MFTEPGKDHISSFPIILSSASGNIWLIFSDLSNYFV
jgi:hypothetical protein